MIQARELHGEASQSQRGGSIQAFEILAQIEPAVEQVLDLTQIAMRVLPLAEGVMGAGQRRFNVA